MWLLIESIGPVKLSSSQCTKDPRKQVAAVDGVTRPKLEHSGSRAAAAAGSEAKTQRQSQPTIPVKKVSTIAWQRRGAALLSVGIEETAATRDSDRSCHRTVKSESGRRF